MRPASSKLFLVGVLLLGACAPRQGDNPDLARWERQAQNVTITRDDWGIPHIRGKTDADAVFGLVYAQAEDDFNRVETNFINSQGRLAEAQGEGEIYRDLRMKLFVDPDSLKKQYDASPDSLKALMNAWADGLNYFLHTHSAVKPRVITRFEPWMALSFTEGSIGGDIERVSLQELEAFYGDSGIQLAEAPDPLAEPTGSNGIAIAPSNTAAGKALLLINPHTSFFFRAEVQVTSDQGLNAYGAVTWGQFFVYQGFNDRAGWMHTSSGVDNIDEYLETIVETDSGLFYRYGSELRRVITKQVTIPYNTANGQAKRDFTVYYTHHGPIVRKVGDKWVSVRLMQEPIKALTQSYYRTKARNIAEYRNVMELHTNSSNNTLYADADGNIAYFHANFIPRRSARFDWSKPVDGSNTATEWDGVHSIDESPNSINPPNGWVQNTNNWPYSAAGANSPKPSQFPKYVDPTGENPRGIHAMMVLKDRKDFTIEGLRQAAYDSYMPAFESLIPTLVGAYDQTPESNPLKAKLREQIDSLRGWDMRWSAQSVPTTLAVFWGDELWLRVRADAESEEMTVYDYMAKHTTPAQRLEALATISDKLAADFGTWKTPWGEVNRFQRLTADIVHPFDDNGPSIPVPFTTGRWGSLASFGARPYQGSKKIYGTSGNSFVAVVEFGRDSVRAIAITAGGQSGDTRSKHFSDQAERYANGALRPVYFYPSQLQGHVEREYRPGSRE